MCTVSWRREPGGYELWFNRDELNTRAPESPPMLQESEGVAFLAPRDGARGGTWLLVNEHGLTVCLLNDYASPWRAIEGRDASPRRPRTVRRTVPTVEPFGPVSRGGVVMACAAATDLRGVTACVRAQPLARLAAFHLLALAPDDGPLLLHWDGARLRERSGAAVRAPLSSSSFATAEVIAARLARFPAFADPGDYHRQHDPRAGAYSVLMRRPDAATRSLCRVRVDRDRVRLDYEAVAWGDDGQDFSPVVRHELLAGGGLK
jgi:hypothetical protein